MISSLKSLQNLMKWLPAEN